MNMLSIALGAMVQHAHVLVKTLGQVMRQKARRLDLEEACITFLVSFLVGSV